MKNMTLNQKLWVDEKDREDYSGSTIFFAHLRDLKKKFLKKTK